MVTKNREFKHKIGYNSPYVRDITHIRASSTGFGAGLLKGDSHNWLRPTPVGMVTKTANFNVKFAINLILDV